MKILALESSAKAASVALCEDAFLIAESYQNCGLTHSRTLMPMCEDLLKNSGISLSEVDLIACANGPGSFTGLRIGLATAKGLAWTEEKPCLGVSTLEAMAWNLTVYDGIVCCAMDARRNQVYHALFRATAGRLERLTEDRAISLEELFSTEKNRLAGQIVVGDGAQLCYDYGKKVGVEVRLAPPNLRFQHGWGVARAALEQIQQGKRGTGGDLTAHYLRLSQAERERAARLKAEQQAEIKRSV